MPLSIESVLGFATLMKAVKEIESGVPRTLPAAYYTVRAEDRIIGDRARNFRFRGNRQPARIAAYGSPPRQVKMQPRSVQDVVLLHTIENITFRQEFLRLLMDWKAGSYIAQQQAGMEIREQTMEFKTRFDTLRSACIHNTLAAGKLYFDADGSILPNSTGAVTVFDNGIPAMNMGQIDPGSGPIINASWASATTDIPTQVNNLIKRSVQQTGKRITTAFYGANIPGYMLNNEKMKYYLARNPVFQQAFSDTGMPPEKMLRLNWIPVYETFHENNAGVIVEPFPADQITFAPDPTPDTYRLLEGSYLIPKDYNPTGTIDAALGNMDLVYGMFEYAQVNRLHLPNSEFVAGDTFVPWLPLPEAYYIVDTTP